MKHTVIGWIAPILVIIGLACVSPAPVRAGDDLLLGGDKRAGGKVMQDTASLSPEETPYGKSVLAASGDSALDTPSDPSTKDSASGEKSSDGSSSLSGDDSTPKDDEEKPKKKKKKSWWPFGRSSDDSSSKKKKKTEEKETAAEATPSPSPDDQAAAPASTEKSPAAPSEGDKAQADRRLKDLKESLPPDITDRATRGESHIKELLDRARAIKARQAEREQQAADESRVEDQRRREAEQEEARQRELALKAPEEPAAAPDEELTGKKSKLSKGTKDKIKALQQQREELFAEGAPQEKIDKLDAKIASLKKSGKSASKLADAGTASKKGKSKKSKSTESTGKKKKKKQKAEDLVAPSLPADASPEPLATADADAPTKKKKKAGKKKKAEGTSEAAASGTPPADGNEFKLDTGAASGSPGLSGTN